MMTDWQACALAAARANAAYVIDETASKVAFEALGDVWVAMYANSSHQAVISVDSQCETHLSISGTRFSALKLMDVFADMSLDPVSVDGGNVTAGVYEGMRDMWDWVLSTVPDGDVIHVSGHSLGGARTHLTPLFLPTAQIGQLHSFEAPKFADAAFYATHAEALSGMVCVLNGADLWASWPWKEGPLRDLRWQARPAVTMVGEGRLRYVLGHSQLAVARRCRPSRSRHVSRAGSHREDCRGGRPEAGGLRSVIAVPVWSCAAARIDGVELFLIARRETVDDPCHDEERDGEHCGHDRDRYLICWGCAHHANDPQRCN